MSIIDQLEQTVTPAILGEHNRSDSVAYISLLEQFYAILATRLAVPQVYSQLLRNDQVMANDSIAERPLFEQLWQDQVLQKTIIQELSAAHHIDESITAQLLINAASLAYRELKVLANGQFLPAFLQGEQSTLRPYLPIWSASVITATQGAGHESMSNFVVDVADNGIAPSSDTLPNKLSEPDLSTDAVAATTATTAAYVENANISATDALNDNEHFGDSNDAIHASPAAHHLAENSNVKRERVRTRNQRNDLLMRVFLLIVALAAMALAAWALLIKPKSDLPVEPVAVAPVVTPAPPPAPTMTPIDFIVGVDDSGNLYTCSATVGDAALQSSLQQALNTSFGEQASICEFTVQNGIATTIANMPAEILPNVLTMLRSTPFARLHLQNDRLTVEAPDDMLLQQLVTNVRSLAPTMAVDSTAPLPLPNNSNGDTTYGMAGTNGVNNQLGDGTGANNQYSNDGMSNGTGEYQAADDDTGDRVIPAPLPNNNDEFNNNSNNVPANVPSNIPSNVPSSNRPSRPSGPISESEVDDMASSVIVAEPAQVR
ncbi:hypothetical protein [Psychrobacter pacificensis]|uniref:hypothetical protein n=1 Tax=Psychrobacter pacificensis TaxID=112002 RepID=UPI001CBB20C0|nr:hypothetical protein [Psychrobacter pacificensis]MBZ1392854.1 hypothetical protein [Psychrobacter pacificensis]